MRNRHTITVLLSGLILHGLFLPANLSAPVSAADPPGDAAKRFGAEFIPADGIGFVSIRVKEILGVKWVETVQRKLGPVATKFDHALNKEYFIQKVTDVERVLLVMAGSPEDTPVVIITMSDGFDRNALMKLVKKEELKDERVGDHTIYIGDEEIRGGSAYCAIDDKILMCGPTGSVKSCLAALADKKRSGPLVEALKELDATSQFAVAINPGRVPLVRPPLPPEIRPVEPLTRARWIALEGSLADGLKVVAKVNCRKEKDVADIKKAMETGQTMLADLLAQLLKDNGFREEIPSTVKLLEQVLAELKGAKVESDGQIVHAKLQVKFEGELFATALDEAVARIRMEAHRARSMSNLRQIAIAFNNIDSIDGKLCGPAIYSKEGKPLLSWRVAILPYIEEINLYRQFNRDEPWDSEHNKKMLEKMPSLYAPTMGTVKDKTVTYYKVFVGKGAGFEENRQFTLAQISTGNGTSNTISAIEAGDPVPWTKPEDIPFDLNKPLPKLVGPFKGKLSVAFFDGHVLTIPADVDPKKLRGSIMREESDLNLNTPEKPKGSGLKKPGGSASKE